MQADRDRQGSLDKLWTKSRTRNLLEAELRSTGPRKSVRLELTHDSHATSMFFLSHCLVVDAHLHACCSQDRSDDKYCMPLTLGNHSVKDILDTLRLAVMFDGPPAIMADQDKTPDITTSETSGNSIRGDGTIDDALVFLRKHREEQTTGAQDPRYMKRLRWKIDRYVITFLALCYSLNFLDKVLLNYGQVMGLSKDLHLKGNDFSNAASAFFIAVLVAVLPNIYLLQRLPTAKWLATCLIAWGICTACHAALQNYGGLLAVRILSGAFESVVPSALMLLTAQWYTRPEQAARFGYYYCGLGIGQIFGGLISFAFQHVSPSAPLAGWRIMFLSLGLFTIACGIVVFWLVPDTPMTAWFLSDAEKVAVLEHVKGNQTGIENVHFHPKQILEALLDFQVWTIWFMVVLNSMGGGVITTYSAMLIKGFGFTSKEAALLNMPAGVVNITTTLFCAIGSRFFGHRWAWISGMTFVAVIGACLMAFLDASNRAGLLVSIYMVNSITAPGPIMYQWLVGNTAGHTKRAFVAAAINAAFAVGNIIGPQTFQASDAPGYRPAKVALICAWVVEAAMAWMLAIYYLFINRRRDRKAGGVVEEVTESKAFAGLTDRQNSSFRYQY